MTTQRTEAGMVGAGERARSDRFSKLFETYQSALRRLVGAYAANPADRDDLLQDIAVGIWQSLPGFRGDSSERTWIYRIAHNIAIRTTARARTRDAREPLLARTFDAPSRDASAEDALIVNEKRQALLNSIRELPILDRQVLTLHLEGLSAAEIEEVTGVSQGAVATRLTRIRQRIAEQVQAEGTAS
jgi:RNA polymerase sigma factor (sigma-70 family)